MRKQVEIVNKLGLHARPAALFVRYVLRFKSIITICKGEENFSAASLLEVLTANLNCGDRVVLEAIGPDEQEALNELETLLLRFRDEEQARWTAVRLAREKFSRKTHAAKPSHVRPAFVVDASVALWRRGPPRSTNGALHGFKKIHKAVIHVQLHVAVEKT